MGENDVHLPGGSFSGLLLSAEYPPLFSANTPKILSFGDFAPQINPNSSNSTPTPNAFNTLKRQNGSGLEPRKRSRRKKKDEMGPTPAIRTTSVVHAKVRREKLGERIAALQQLVSPFGKTDTASVLHEAMGYIRFLEDQVKVLSSPYLQCSNHLSVSTHNISVFSFTPNHFILHPTKIYKRTAFVNSCLIVKNHLIFSQLA